MRIAVWHNLPSGGGKRALFHHVAGLLARGHEVEAWCPPPVDADYLTLGDIVREHVVPLALSAERGSRGGFFKSAERLRRLDAHCRRCAAEIAAGGFDALLAGTCFLTRSAPIARYVELPSALYLQEPYRWFYECLPSLPWRALPPARGPSLRWLRRWMRDLVKIQGYRIQAREELANAKAFDRILVNSLFSRESVLRAYGLDSTVCYLGVDTSLFRPIDVPRENFAVCVGGLAFGKGAERVIRAIGSIEDALRPELVWIANFEDARYRARIEKLASLHGVAFRVKVGIADQQLVEYLNRAAVMLYAPLLEPFGLVPLEANACETPVVALAEGGVRESILDGVNGILVLDGDPAELGRALGELLADPERARALGERARRHVVENWSWKVACDRLEQELHRTIRSATWSRRPAADL
jgi:glycosyltransferase involved in cell wall biosynthesis